jgi:hypothetical protein
MGSQTYSTMTTMTWYGTAQGQLPTPTNHHKLAHVWEIDKIKLNSKKRNTIRNQASEHKGNKRPSNKEKRKKAHVPKKAHTYSTLEKSPVGRVASRS